MWVCAMRRMECGSVAVNSATCFSSGACWNRNSMSSTKPICSISSPSSSTRNLSWLERQRAALDVIEHASGGADHHVGAALQSLELRRVTLSAVDRQHVEAGHLRGVFLEGFGHLDGELARGREDQRLRCAQLDVDLREDGQRECGRLAGAGLRLAEQVGATQDHRDGLRLDGRGRLVAHIAEGGDDGVAKPKLGEAGWGCGFSHRFCWCRGRHHLKRGAQFTLNPPPRHENRAKSAIRRPKSTLSGRARVLLERVPSLSTSCQS